MSTTYLISEPSLTDIADAIREKTGDTAKLAPAQMPDAIRSLSADRFSTLPPPVTSLSVSASDQSVSVSFEPVGVEFEPYLGDPAYIVVLKEGSMPQSPNDGTVMKLDKTGKVVG